MKTSPLLSAGLVCLALVAIGCDKKQQDKPAETTTSANAETTPKVDPHAPKPSTGPKYTLAVEPEEDREATVAKAEKLAEFLSKETGATVDVYVPKESGELVEAMSKKKANVAYVSAWSYLAAHLNADAGILAVEERDGKTTHQTSFFVRADSAIKKTSDFKGKKIAFTSPTSTSGYLYPMMKLIEDGLVKRDDDLADVVDDIMVSGSYPASFKALIDGKVDIVAAADYAPALYLSEEDQKKIKPIISYGPVPTHVFAVRAEVTMDEQKKLQEALLELNDEPNNALLKSIYGADKLVVRSHGDHVYKLQQELDRLEVDYPLD